MSLRHQGIVPFPEIHSSLYPSCVGFILNRFPYGSHSQVVLIYRQRGERASFPQPSDKLTGFWLSHMLTMGHLLWPWKCDVLIILGLIIPQMMRMKYIGWCQSGPVTETKSKRPSPNHLTGKWVPFNKDKEEMVSYRLYFEQDFQSSLRQCCVEYTLKNTILYFSYSFTLWQNGKWGNQGNWGH